MEHLNLIQAAGLIYSATGALFVLLALPSVIRGRNGLAATSARDLAIRRAKRYDLRFGLVMAAIGAILVALAASRFSAPLSLWRVPAYGAAFIASIYAVARFFALLPVVSRPSGARRSLFETRRSRLLREAAEREASARVAREVAAAPRDTGVVYLHKQWERRWWSDKLGVSADAIESAIRHAGRMTRDVEQHLADRGYEVRPLAA